MAIGQRANGILDFFGDAMEEFRQGQRVQPQTTQVLTPPMASPVDQPPASPLQRAMGVPQTIVSSTGQTMATDYPDGRLAMASTTPQVQQQFRGMPQSGMPTPPQVMTVQDRPDLNQEVRAQQSPLGQGQFTPEMLRKAEDASKVVEQVQRNPQIQQDPSFMDRVKDYFGSRENMVRLALAFNSMRLTPDTGLAAALGSELKDLRAVKVADKRSNATLNALRQAGVPEKDLQVLANDPELLRKYATEFFKKQLGTLPAEQQAFENLIAGMSEADQEKARRIKAGLDPRAGSQFALSLQELFERSAAQAGGSQKGKSEEERKQLQVQSDKTWNIWQTAISGLEESLGATSTGKIVGLLPAITSNQQIAEQAIAIMAPVLKNIFRESGEGVFTDKDQQILIDMIPDRTANPETIAYAIKMINDIVAAKLNQPTSDMEMPAPSGGGQVLRFDAQGNPI